MRPTRSHYRQSPQKVNSNFALCVQKLFTAERHGDKINNNLIKLLPSYQKRQQQINISLAEQLPKFLFKKARRLAIDLVLIPYHGTYDTEHT